MAVLPQLADPAGYCRSDWDLLADHAARATWVSYFRTHLGRLLDALRASYPTAAPDRVSAFAGACGACFDRIAARPADFAPLDILRIDQLRQDLLIEHGFPDPYRDAKRRENAVALARLGPLLCRLDQAAEAALPDLLARGVMAGNLFDLGALPMIERLERGGGDALAALIPARPWFIDDVPAFFERVGAGRYGHAACFVDNAGGDILLGCVPLARWLLRHVGRVTLVANELPALNDITAAELTELLPQAAQVDAELHAAVRAGRIGVLSSGTGAPGIDFTALSPGCVAALGDADLLWIHGMGRSCESNWQTRFRCDALRTCVLKDELNAARRAARLLDCVFRFEAA